MAGKSLHLRNGFNVGWCRVRRRPTIDNPVALLNNVKDRIRQRPSPCAADVRFEGSFPVQWHLFVQPQRGSIPKPWVAQRTQGLRQCEFRTATRCNTMRFLNIARSDRGAVTALSPGSPSAPGVSENPDGSTPKGSQQTTLRAREGTHAATPSGSEGIAYARTPGTLRDPGLMAGIPPGWKNFRKRIVSTGHNLARQTVAAMIRG